MVSAVSEKQHDPDVVKWYTRARKFPQLIGRTPDGARIWGGPYTITQAVGAGGVLFVGLNTMGLWAGFGFVGNLVVLLGVAYGVVIILGRIPVGSRNPISVMAGAVRASGAPQYGRIGGKQIRLRRPHRLRHQVLVCLDVPPQLVDEAAVAADVAPNVVNDPEAPRTAAPRLASTPEPRQPALTGLQALLASSSAHPTEETR